MSDLVTTRIFVDGEKGITAAKLNDIVASSVIQPAFYTSKPTAGTADPTDIVLILKSGAYAQVPVSTLGGSATQSQIWATRLRSFNALSNPGMEVNQRFPHPTVVNAGSTVSSGFVLDRWLSAKGGASTLTYGSGQQAAVSGELVVPGTSFQISRSFLRVTLTGQQASLAGGDYLLVQQYVEGPTFRELQYDVHSFSILCRSSVAGLKFAISFRDPTSANSLCLLCTIPAASTWTLLTLPNLPLWPSGGTFSNVAGNAGYIMSVVLAAGATVIAPAAGTWQTGTFYGAPSMSNFAGSPVNSTFDIAFVQHEPGAVCSTFMDKPFSQNLDECLRYFQKSYDLATVVGAVTSLGMRTFMSRTAANADGVAVFHKPMAKIPTVTLYDHNNGAVNSVMDGAAVHHTGASATYVNTTAFTQLGFTTATTALMPVWCQYIADTGW